MRFKINLLHFLLITVFLGTSIGLYISNMPGEMVDLTSDNFKTVSYTHLTLPTILLV